MDSESDLSDNHRNALQQYLVKDQIICPSRHEFLEKLPVNIRLRLKEGYVEIAHHLAKLALGEDRYNAILKQCEDDSPPQLFLSDNGYRVVFFWRVKNVVFSPIEPYASSLAKAAGPIRNQLDHHICWAYTGGDVVSITRVLYGLDDRFTPLSAQYLCRNVSPEDMKTSQDGKHCCYGHDALDTLVFIKMRGVPVERPDQKTFSCLEDGDYESEYRRIENIYRYDKLQDALVRLQTHPVVATLQLFEGWDTEAIYRGPFHGGKYEGAHGVVMIGCKQIEGETVAVCKSSNGKDLGRRGYIYVSLDVMIMDAAGLRKNRPSDQEDSNPLVVENNPVYLLRNFLSVDVDVGKKGKMYISKETYEENLRFRYVGGRGILGGMALHKSEITEMRTGGSLEYLPLQVNPAADGGCSESGKFLVSLGGQLCRVWEVNTSSAVAVLSKEKDEMFACCSFSVDSAGNEVLYVAAKTERGGMIINSWNRRGSSKLIKNNPISAIKVSADGKLLAVGTIEGDVLILDLTKMQPKQIVKKAHLGTVTALIFSPDSRCLVSVDSDSWARITMIKQEGEKSGIKLWGGKKGSYLNKKMAF